VLALPTRVVILNRRGFEGESKKHQIVCGRRIVAEEQYFWDLVLAELMQLFARPWNEPIISANLRQSTVIPFAMRALRRTRVVDGLFRAGYYSESHALVRGAYEDWLEIAYLMREPGDARCVSYALEVHQQDARVYDAFKELCGKSVAERFFPALSAGVGQFAGLSRTITKPLSLAYLADDLGLKKIHDFVYTYLSDRSHPTGRAEEPFDASASIAVASVPKRNDRAEIRLALWYTWFTARALVLASREFGIDWEPFCDQYLLPIALEGGRTPETCVFVRENGAKTS
jgi:hypothetical protein